MSKQELQIAIKQYLGLVLEKYTVMKLVGFNYRDYDHVNLHELDLAFFKFINDNNLKEDFIKSLPNYMPESLTNLPEMEQEQPVANIPAKIYLQANPNNHTDLDYNELGGVTFSTDQINKSDVEYVRLYDNSVEPVSNLYKLEKELSEEDKWLFGSQLIALWNNSNEESRDIKKFLKGYKITKQS